MNQIDTLATLCPLGSMPSCVAVHGPRERGPHRAASEILKLPAGSIFRAATTIQANVASAYHGGTHSLGLIWLFQVPVMAMLLMGRRATVWQFRFPVHPEHPPPRPPNAVASAASARPS